MSESKNVFFDTKNLTPEQTYRLLASVVVPRPIAWVVSQNSQGLSNAAPFSFFNALSGHPPVVCLGIGHRDGQQKDTLKNIEETHEFVIHMVSENLAEAMNETSKDLPYGKDELEDLGLATQATHIINSKIISDCPVALECVYQQTLSVGKNGSGIVVGEVVAVHVHKNAVLDIEKCYIDTKELHLIGRMESPGWYTYTDKRFSLEPQLKT